MRQELNAQRSLPGLSWRDFQDFVARVQNGINVDLVFLEQLPTAIDRKLVIVEVSKLQARIGKLGVVEAEQVEFHATARWRSPPARFYGLR